MTLGTSKQAYGDRSYWDNRYSQDPRPFDWYQKYSALSPLLDLYVRRDGRILLVGCGNSVLGEDMVSDGYQDVVNIDISSVVIDAMQKKYLDCPELKYIKMDVRDMNAFESGSFDAVIDKGTLDSLMCGHNAQQNAAKMLEEVGRILKDRGIYVLITYGAPCYRLPLLREPCSWTIKLHVIEKLGSETSPHPKWELTDPVLLNENGSSVTAVLGENPDVHYIYVCIKAWVICFQDESLRPALKHEGEEHSS
ncbi:uncharacterized protein LOC131224686 isoform X3 [Magnolia sinica]|uniref:uncharacterized protein LOC131224686 isoform X3 n=2 Tax=Magnolia sinica TaxID=86752 RepID=UPI00265B1AA4|nr:uncharacterized protein LOC131224686 isoform X3 [Magnolia sinica]XP_058075962.1 uncharacterized protein LOC131224686 isoform X3 [Magnolia sinica]